MIGRRGEVTATVESQSLSFTMISDVFNSAHPSHTYPTIARRANLRSGHLTPGFCTWPALPVMALNGHSARRNDLTDFLYQRHREIIAFARPDLAVSGMGSSSMVPVVLPVWADSRPPG